MATVNLAAAWIGILCGFVAGAISGLFFANDGWLGGYSSWPRRMVRLGHISFFGLALINFAYAVTVRVMELASISPWPSRLFIVGAVTMPLVCYLSAYRRGFRHLFAVPVLSLVLGVALFTFKEVLP